MTLEDVLGRMSGSQRVFIVDSIHEQPFFDADYAYDILRELSRTDDELLVSEVTKLGTLDEKTIYLKVKFPRRYATPRR